jgi:hypothetical protein
MSVKPFFIVHQGYYAEAFSKHLAAAITSTTKRQIHKKTEKFKYADQIYFVQALSKMNNTTILIFNRSLEKSSQWSKTFELSSSRQPRPCALTESTPDVIRINKFDSFMRTKRPG